MNNVSNYHCVILDRDSNVIQRSRNLAGIRRYVSGSLRFRGYVPRNLIEVIDINAVHGEGRLSILFEDGSSFETDFACCVVLKNWVRRWRNAYGAPLRVQGKDCGVVGYHNPALS